MEELFLRCVLAGDELHVVDHQHVDAAELLLEGDRVLIPQGADELVHELFRRQVDHLAGRIALADGVGDGMHQMRLAQADAAIEIERVERHGGRIGHALGGGIGELIGLADHEILEGEARIERRRNIVVENLRAVAQRRRPLARIDTGGLGGGRLGGFLERRIGLARRHRRLDADFDRGDGAVFAGPQRHQALGVMAVDPVAHEARRHHQAQTVLAQFAQGQRLQPAAIGQLADFLAQARTHARPLGIDLDLIGADVSCGPLRHNLHALPWADLYFCSHGNPACFQPPTVPRWPALSIGPSNPSLML